MTDTLAIPERVRQIKLDVAAECRVTVADIDGKSQVTKIVQARWQAMRAVRDMPTRTGKPPSYPQIAAWFGRTEHTAVLYACKPEIQDRRRERGRANHHARKLGQSNPVEQPA